MIAEKKKQGRHHNSKNFKKYGSVYDCIIDTENPKPDELKVVEEYCKVWWNGFNTSKEIRQIVSAIDICKTNKEKEAVLKPVYYIYAENSIDFRRDVTRLNFTYTFILGLPFFKKWIAEEDRSKMKNITGTFSNYILSTIKERADQGQETTHTRLYWNQPEDIFLMPANFDGNITKMIKKGYLKTEKKYNNTHYYLTDKIGFDGVFFEKVER